jgi:hypothetical protein
MRMNTRPEVHVSRADDRQEEGARRHGRRSLLRAAAAAMVGAAAAPVNLRATHDETTIVGTWSGALSAPFGEISHLISFHGDGVVIASATYLVKPTPFGDLLETTSHGVWRRTGHRRFEAVIRLFTQLAETGVRFGTDNARFALEIARDSRTLKGTFAIQGTDTAGIVLFEFSGDYLAQRIGF